MKYDLAPRFFVVIHAQHRINNNDLALAHILGSAKMAYEAKATGVFLIPDYENESNGYSKRATSEDLFSYYAEIKKSFPALLTGVNFLQRFKNMETSLVERIYQKNFDLIQSDGLLAKILYSSKKRPKTEFFMGLAFKYSKKEKAKGEILKSLCQAIPNHANVIPTTSGRATGEAASLEKIRAIRSYLPKAQRLGIASGISLENVDLFLEAGVTDFLVATSLIQEKWKGFDMLDEEKVKALAKKILL